LAKWRTSSVAGVVDVFVTGWPEISSVAEFFGASANKAAGRFGILTGRIVRLGKEAVDNLLSGEPGVGAAEGVRDGGGVFLGKQSQLGLNRR
jgi:hypothetical protein